MSNSNDSTTQLLNVIHKQSPKQSLTRPTFLDRRIAITSIMTSCYRAQQKHIVSSKTMIISKIHRNFAWEVFQISNNLLLSLMTLFLKFDPIFISTSVVFCLKKKTLGFDLCCFICNSPTRAEYSVFKSTHGKFSRVSNKTSPYNSYKVSSLITWNEIKNQ